MKRTTLALDRAELTALLLAILQTQRGNGWHADTQAALERARLHVDAALVKASRNTTAPAGNHS